MPTTVDIVIRLQVAGSTTDVERYRAALERLADVMCVQAEDGLWSAGYPDGETDEGPSEHIADVENALTHAILIADRDADIDKELPCLSGCLPRRT